MTCPPSLDALLGRLEHAPSLPALAFERGVILPLVGVPPITSLEVVGLKTAMETGEVEVRELENPRVENLIIKSHSKVAVFIPAGLLLRGGGQNRIVATPTIVLPGQQASLDVMCVERGRWTPRHHSTFERTETAPARIGSAKRRREVRARRRGIVRARDQHHTWDEVTRFLGRTHTHSQTEDLSAGSVRLEADRLSDTWRQIEPRWQAEGTSGVAAFTLDGRFRGLETIPAIATMWEERLRAILESWSLQWGAPQMVTPRAAWCSGLGGLLERLAQPRRRQMTHRSNLDLIDLDWAGLPYLGTAVLHQDVLLGLTVEGLWVPESLTASIPETLAGSPR